MPPRIKLISLNVEVSQHLDRVLPFLRREMPDVAAIQELNELDVPRFREALGGAPCLFVPMGRHVRKGTAAVIGIGIFSRLPVKKQDVRYYEGTPGSLQDSDLDKPETYNLFNRAVAICDVEKEGTEFRIANTHFTWSSQGQATDLQREKMRALLAILETQGDFVLVGDFNAPRGGEIFGMLAARYKDNIPPHYRTSLDISLHRAGKTQPEELSDKMVDGIFSTPGYAVSDVEMVPGLSDHCALRATVTKAMSQ